MFHYNSSFLRDNIYIEMHRWPSNDNEFYYDLRVLYKIGMISTMLLYMKLRLQLTGLALR